jgi:predicted metalloprotease with PDZ domain
MMRRIRGRGLVQVLWVATLLLTSASAQPQATRRYPGVIALQVDVTDVQRRIYRVTETIPVRPGPLVLYYPQWLPGNHAPRGQIDQLAGLRFRAGDRELAWKRDPLNVYAFTLQVPAGVTQLVAEFQVATPQATDSGRVARVQVTPNLLGLQWNQVVLYPAGYAVRDIQVRATLQLPPGWKHATALTADTAGGAVVSDRVQFATVSLEHLVDSPLFAGRYTRQIDLAPAGTAPVRLNVVADEAGDLAATDEQVAIHRALVREAYAAFGPPHYQHYDFLVALSDHFGGIGLEHHQSTEIVQAPAYFRSWDEDVDSRDLLAHEYVHSWNGKYRRPARLWTPHYNTPMQDDLLWVYEGMTQYYGMILAARSGLWPQDFAREELALTAAIYDRKRAGRAWRSLEDTTYQPIIANRKPLAWPSWQRTEDYYLESALLWLDVDTRLRELSNGRRSLDDFARAFFAAPPSQGLVSTYEFADVVKGLNAVAAYDWNSFLRSRVGGTNQPVTEGLERAGFRLVYSDQPNATISDYEKASRITDLGYSLGVTLSRDAVLTDVVWDSPAFKAGLTTNTTLVAVDGRAYSAEILKDAITRSGKGGAPIELLVRNQDRFRTVTVTCPEGLRYPHLVPIEGRADGLKAVLAPAG